MHETAIHTDKLSRAFGSLLAVDSVSLDIPRGAIFGFLGPNGAGKTTTIQLLLGLLEPTTGNAAVLGHDVRREGHFIRERTGALLEHTGLYERLSAEANLEFHGRIYRMPPGERRDRIRELLVHFGLWDRRHEKVGTWSRGMKQKCAVARALLHGPELVFLDEPTAGLDPVAAAQLRDDIASLVETKGTTVFLTTHNLNEAEKLCDLVGVINRGALVSVGHPDTLRSSAGNLHAEITAEGVSAGTLDTIRRRPDILSAVQKNGKLLLDMQSGASLAPIVAALVREGAAVEEVRKGKATLEEAFLSLMEERADE